MTPQLRRGAIAAALLLVLAAPVAAHDPGLSSLNVTVTRDNVIADLSLSEVDADAAGHLADFAIATIRVRIDQRDLHGAVELIGREGGDAVRVRVVYARAAGSTLFVRSGVPHRLQRGHRQLLSIRNEGGGLLAERMLDRDADGQTVDLAASGHGNRTAPWPFSLGVAIVVVLLGSMWLIRASRRTDRGERHADVGERTADQPLCFSTFHSVSASDSPSHGSGT